MLKVKGCSSRLCNRGSLSRPCLAPKKFYKFGAETLVDHCLSAGWSWALFTCQKILQNFSYSPSYRIFRRMHGVLNIDENKN